MKKFNFEVTDGFFPSTFEGETEALNIEEATSELKEWYAMELGTAEEEIQVKIWEA